MQNNLIKGLHHVSALADDAGKNAEFYTVVLGLRMVKKTINYDDPGVYHLYYGNENGDPGTIMTFFPYSGMRKGRHGTGQMTVTSFSVPGNAIEYWTRRFDRMGIRFTKPTERFSEIYIAFEDVHGLGLELVFNDNDKRPAFSNGQIPVEYSVRGFYGVTLAEDRHERTSLLLMEGLDYKLLSQKENRIRYGVEGKLNEFVDIVYSPGAARGLSGSGTIHHVAFSTENDAAQLEARQRLVQLGRDVTPVIDRQYFHSVYFREPGGILFELATVPPGFSVDENPKHLGEELKLPVWLEPERQMIEDNLEPLRPI
ncbi:MAG TPA: ring-cleaving dioxygenase [Bacteroidales bacterium]|nr:ring-cleaving dioxygenase [Bacteroidales bacterium]